MEIITEQIDMLMDQPYVKVTIVKKGNPFADVRIFQTSKSKSLDQAKAEAAAFVDAIESGALPERVTTLDRRVIKAREGCTCDRLRG